MPVVLPKIQLSKASLAQAGIVLATKFCVANNLPIPRFVLLTREDNRYYLDSCGYYRKNVVHVMVDKCAAPGTGGRAWSWPGYIIDRTPYGVIAHELGHHIDVHSSVITKNKVRVWAYSSEFCVKVKEESGEPKLTNYCPNPAEWFAEMCRLFVTNSELLRAFRPKTHEVFCRYLKPVINRPWREVLLDNSAPSRIVSMAMKKVADA